MNNIFEEYKEYLKLNSEKAEINNKLLTLSGKNDEGNLRLINEMASKTNSINSEIEKFNDELIPKVREYFNTQKDFNTISEEIKTIEKLSKKNGRKVAEVLSDEGRKKEIAIELLDEYKNLVEQKKKLRVKFSNNYNSIRKITTIKNSEKLKNDSVETSKEQKIFITEKDVYESLSVEDKIKETEERLQRIFNSSLLPNQGKKIVITYNDEKREIPEKYKGVFLETIRELGRLKNSQILKTNEEPKMTPSETKEETTIVQDNLDNAKEKSQLTLVDLINHLEVNDIKLHPIPVTFKKRHKISLKNGIVAIKNKLKLSKIKQKIISIFNIDKKVELSFQKIEAKLLDKGIVIKKDAVKFAQTYRQKFNKAKAFVTSIPSKTKNFVKNKYNQFKEYKREKKEINNQIKDGVEIREAMDNVYGAEKEKHIDYRIVNRVFNFRDGICQRVNEGKTKICEMAKNTRDKIKRPFDKMREEIRNDAKRQDLITQIEKLKRENLVRKDQMRRIRIKEAGGYITTGIIIAIPILVGALLIFAVVCAIINS